MVKAKTVLDRSRRWTQAGSRGGVRIFALMRPCGDQSENRPGTLAARWTQAGSRGGVRIFALLRHRGGEGENCPGPPAAPRRAANFTWRSSNFCADAAWRWSRRKLPWTARGALESRRFPCRSSNFCVDAEVRWSRRKLPWTARSASLGSELHVAEFEFLR